MRNATHKQSLPVYIMYIAGLLLFTLNLLRVLNVTITHDEALTYQWYVTHSYADIISGSMITANNHFLNSILAKFFIELFSDNLFFLRLPNLLAYAAYLILSIAITRKLFSNAWWVLSCFLLLQLNPFMFEFFGLCRGYGLSIAFMIAAIYALLNFIQTRKIASVISVSVCMFLAVFSNLSMLNMLMTFQLILLLYWWQNRKMQGALKPLLISILLTLITLAAVYEPIRLLIEKAQLYYGGDKGFVNDTVQSLLHETFFLSAEGDGLLITSWLISSIVLLVGLMLTIKAVRSKQLSNTWFVLWLLLFVPALSTVTQNILLGNKYLIERTALFLYPLFTLFIVYSIYHAGKLKNGLIAVILLIMSFNFSKHLNFTTSRSWPYDNYNKWLLDRMIAEKENDGEIKVYLDGFFTPGFRYYVPREYKGKFGQLGNHGEQFFEWSEYDYCLIRESDKHRIPDLFIVDTVFSEQPFYLFKRKD